MEYVLLCIGILLACAGVALVFLKRETASVAVILIPGILLCLAGAPGILGAKLSGFGLQADITKQVKEEVLDAKTETKQQDIGPLRLDIQIIKDALAKQESFNQDVSSKINAIVTSSNTPAIANDKVPQPNINAVPAQFASNNKYSVIVFYRDTRSADATSLLNALITAGYQASTINTSLGETQVGPQPDNSTYIIPTSRGLAVEGAVADIVKKTLPPPRNQAVTVGSDYPLRRGDVQIYLY